MRLLAIITVCLPLTGLVAQTSPEDPKATMEVEAIVVTSDEKSLKISESSYLLYDTGPAGGIIFYDKGDYDGGWRYLEAAPADLGRYKWGGDLMEIGGTSDAIGSGKANTEKIVAKLGSGNYAAKACLDYAVNGYEDWFLPSKDELYELYKQRDKIAELVSGSWPWYWTSSEFSFIEAYSQYFVSGDQFRSSKDSDLRVRSIRAF